MNPAPAPPNSPTKGQGAQPVGTKESKLRPQDTEYLAQRVYTLLMEELALEWARLEGRRR